MSQHDWTQHFIAMAEGKIRPDDVNYWVVKYNPGPKKDKEKAHNIVVTPTQMAVEQAKDKIIKAKTVSNRKRKSDQTDSVKLKKKQRINTEKPTVFDT